MLSAKIGMLPAILSAIQVLESPRTDSREVGGRMCSQSVMPCKSATSSWSKARRGCKQRFSSPLNHSKGHELASRKKGPVELAS